MEDNNMTPVENAQPTENEEAPKTDLKKKVLKEVREWAVAIVAAVVITMVLKSFIFMPIRVDGASMNPTLQDKERLGVTVYDVKIVNTIERGDVVICHYPGRTNKDPILHLFTMKTDFVKRVVGVPGDTITRVSGITFVNGEALDPQMIRLPSRRRVDYEYVLGEDEYFVVGDNRYNSHDSRAWDGPEHELHIVNDVSGDVGPITKDMIMGKVKFTFWPLGDIRGVENNPAYIDPKDVALFNMYNNP